MTNTYTVGKSPVPKWCRDLLIPYRKMDGSTGWEFHGSYKTFELSKGDQITNTNGRLDLIFKGERNGED